jgi:transcription elongation GreA/GreB family factor
MKTLIHSFFKALLVLASISILTATVHAAEFGDNRYACQVITVKDRQGFLMVRMDTLEEALAAAARAQDAQTQSDTREPVKAVVQCVDYPDGRFADAKFQASIERLPR